MRFSEAHSGCSRVDGQPVGGYSYRQRELLGGFQSNLGER